MQRKYKCFYCDKSTSFRNRDVSMIRKYKCFYCDKSYLGELEMCPDCGSKELEILVVNRLEQEIVYRHAVCEMDTVLREDLHSDLCNKSTEQEFYNAYCELHLDRFSREFIFEDMSNFRSST